MGMTITACYIFLAVLLAPAWNRSASTARRAHVHHVLGNASRSITPPVALAAFAAASIAKASPIETGLQAMRIGSIIYFVPFFFVMNPSLVLRGDLTNFPLHIVTALIGVMLVCAGLQGYQPGVGDLRQCRHCNGRFASLWSWADCSSPHPEVA